MILEPTKQKVLEAYKIHKSKKPEVLEPILNGIAKVKFHNHSKYDFTELAKDHNNVAANLRNYINGFSISAREIIDFFSFEDQIKKLEEYDLLYLVIKHFTEAKDKFQHIETETKRIDSTISKIEKEIELLKEYRTALISEVVTGKICILENHAIP